MSTAETTIAVTPDSEQVALVNVFTVAPERQEELLAALSESTEEVFGAVPGFLSANLHAGLDGTRVVNYAQWSSEQAFRDAMQRPEIRAHIGRIAAIAAGYEPTLTRVRAIHHRRDTRG